MLDAKPLRQPAKPPRANTLDPHEFYLTVDDFARRIGRSYRWVQSRIEYGLITAHKVYALRGPGKFKLLITEKEFFRIAKNEKDIATC